MANCLYECLREARLERYYPNFESQGLTMSEGLSELTMQDYSRFGVEDMHDRKRLFQLIQVIKMVQDEGKRCNESCSKPTPPSSPDKLTSSTSTTRDHTDNVTSSSSAYFGDASENLNNSAILAWQNYQSVLHRTSATNQSRFFAEQNEALGLNESRVDIAVKSNSISPSENKENVASNERESATDGPGTEAMPSFTPPRPRQPYTEKVHHGAGYDYGVPQSHARSPRRTLSYGDDCGGGDKIRVCVRKRPMNKREKKAGQADIVQVQGKKAVLVNEAKVAVDLTKYTQQHEFIFDEAFGEECSNEEVHQRTAKPLVSWALKGNKSTCFAYGQTGAGKTHTMLGKRGVKGLYLLAAEDLFQQLKAGEYGTEGQQVYVSFYEIYCGQLFDLLHGRKRLYAREDASHRVCISGLLEIPISNVSELMEIIAYGNTVRRNGSTKVNLDSSRSHAVLQIQLKDSRERDRGRISFIDLAGSERLCEANFLASKQNRHEGAEINQSLLALKECIRALDQEQQHTPFRQSKLTQVLKDSFIGNSRTCMIANISPGNVAADNTLNTLRYADRVKELRKDSPSQRQTAAGSPMRNKTPGSPRIPGSPGNKVRQLRRLTGSGSRERRGTPCVFHPSNVPLSSTPKSTGSPRHAGTGSRVNSRVRAGYGLYSTTPVKGSVKVDSGKRGARRILAGARSESGTSPAHSSLLDRQEGSKEEGKADTQAGNFSPLKPGVHLVRDPWVAENSTPWQVVREPAVVQVPEQPIWEEAGSDTDGLGEEDADREYPEGCSDSSRDTQPNSTQTSDLDNGQEMVSHLDSVLGLNPTAARPGTSAAIGPPAFKKTKVIQTESQRPSRRSSYFPPLRDKDVEECSTISDSSERAANKKGSPPSNKVATEDGIPSPDTANSVAGDQNGATSASQSTPSANVTGPSAVTPKMTTAKVTPSVPSHTPAGTNTPVSAAKMTRRSSKSPTKTPSAVVKEIMSLPSPRDFLGSLREPKNWTIFSDEEATPAKAGQDDGESLRRSLSAPELNELVQHEEKTLTHDTVSPIQAASDDVTLTGTTYNDTQGLNELEQSKPVTSQGVPANTIDSTSSTSAVSTDLQPVATDLNTAIAATKGTGALQPPESDAVTVNTSVSSVRLAAVFNSPVTKDMLPPTQVQGDPQVTTSTEVSPEGEGEESPAKRREDHLKKARSLFLAAHRDQLKDMRKWCEEEEALSSVAQQDFDSYVCRLDSILSKKLEDITSLRARLQNYKQDRPLA
ncbi:kinesin-like protein KIF24 [Branchiostoma floridae]|uniref:Kinesin-like protein KIF24 n=1 Tax=Branchiostoma floridae TaxID=7739 RepID=A0A9J7HWI7_BRAFL|nr:kinesin-like protein KIF24 [Branchiostoma floridae]